jgi:hypothetical protein
MEAQVMGMFDFLKGEKKQENKGTPIVEGHISPLLRPSLCTVVLVESEPYDAVSVSLQSCVLIRRLVIEEIINHHKMDRSRYQEIVDQYGSQVCNFICSCHSQNSERQRIAEDCKQNNILFLSPSPRIVSKGTLLGSSLGVIAGSVVLLLDTGVKLNDEDATRLIRNGVLEFLDHEVGLVVGRKKTAALVSIEFLRKGLGGITRQSSDFMPLINSLETGAKSMGWKTKHIAYLSFM